MKPKNDREIKPEDIFKVYDEFWKPNIEADHGKGFDVRAIFQVKKELYDYWVLLENIPKIFMEITGGRISKPHTCPADVISESEAYTGRLIEDGIADRTKFLESQRDQVLKDLESLKKNLAEAERLREHNIRLKRAVRLALDRCPFSMGALVAKRALEDALVG